MEPTEQQPTKESSLLHTKVLGALESTAAAIPFHQFQGFTLKDCLENRVPMSELRNIPFRRGQTPTNVLGAVFNIESEPRYSSAKRNPDDIYEGAQVSIGPYRREWIDVKLILDDKVATPQEVNDYMKTLQTATS